MSIRKDVNIIKQLELKNEILIWFKDNNNINYIYWGEKQKNIKYPIEHKYILISDDYKLKPNKKSKIYILNSFGLEKCKTKIYSVDKFSCANIINK